MGRDTLYVFGGAVWPSAPWLAAYSLGHERKIDIKQVNLVNGDNFAPEWLKVTIQATLPVIVTEKDEKFVDTKSTVHYLVQNALADKPAGKSSGTDFIDRIHADAVDPNFALLSARNEEELKAKNSGVPGLFIRNRQKALEKYAQNPEGFEAFYTAKLAANGFLNTVYAENGEIGETRQIWFAKSKDAWTAIRSFILNDIPAILPESGYIGGSAPGEDDFHLAAWLARISLLTGATPAADGVLSLKKELGGEEVPQKIVSYWKLWSETEAWKVVYAEGLH